MKPLCTTTTHLGAISYVNISAATAWSEKVLTHTNTWLTGRLYMAARLSISSTPAAPHSAFTGACVGEGGAPRVRGERLRRRRDPPRRVYVDAPRIEAAVMADKALAVLLGKSAGERACVRTHLHLAAARLEHRLHTRLRDTCSPIQPSAHQPPPCTPPRGKYRGMRTNPDPGCRTIARAASLQSRKLMMSSDSRLHVTAGASWRLRGSDPNAGKQAGGRRKQAHAEPVARYAAYTCAQHAGIVVQCGNGIDRGVPPGRV
jgi:hypothetical protein